MAAGAPAGSSRLSTTGFRKIEASIGVSVNDTRSETRIEKTTVRANWRKKRPIIPFMKATGRKIATMAKVVAMTARPISVVAKVAASRGAIPSST